ncbi:bile acid:sodium symporter [Hyphomicrobium sp.]|uniref:bile acid:sodium symporter n=1 Tax=Hyphomicrobium sp. TaxID=82 RepID=UPI00341FD5CD
MINPALAVMLFVTFLQVPLSHLSRAFTDTRFLSALMVGNFVAIPLLVAGLLVARAFSLPTAQRRAIAFSTATRNSLVILPLALAVLGAIPIVPAVIVTQTLVELLSELVYVRVMPRFRA